LCSFNIANRTLRISGGSQTPIVNGGTFNTTGSTVDFNSSNNSQYIPTTNINYNSISINNSNNVFLTNNLTIPSMLSVINGDLDLYGKIITLSSGSNISRNSG
jgi:hypothetical protein